MVAEARMTEEDFADYLDAYKDAAVGQRIGEPVRAQYIPAVRVRAILAIGAHDARAGRMPRTPAEVEEEVARLLVGLEPTPPTAVG